MFITDFLSDPVFSSQIPPLQFRVNGSFVDVSFADSENNILLQSRYYPFDSVATIYDVATLFEANLRSRLRSFDTFSITHQGEEDEEPTTNSVQVLYLDRHTYATLAPDFASSHFLSTLHSRRIPRCAPCYVSFFAKFRDSLTLSVELRARIKSTGDIIRCCNFSLYDRYVAPNTGVFTLDIPLDELLNHAIEFAPTHEIHDNKDIEPISFTISHGDKSMDFYIDDSLNSAPLFMFRNCFNVPEFLTIPASTTTTTELEQELASVNGLVIRYDRQAVISRKVESGSLSAEEAELASQLITSESVNICSFAPMLSYGMQWSISPIVITEADCNHHDRDSELNSISFTYRLATSRPDIVLLRNPEPFSSQFNHHFD